MKKLLTILIALFLMQFAVAQVSVTASGHVNYENGDPAVGVDVEIYTDSTASGWTYFNTVQTDATGFYSDTFDAPAGMTQGAVYFSLFDCDGTLLTDVDYWTPVGDPTADFTYCVSPSNDCTVTIIDSLYVQGGLDLYAATSGNAPYTYAWNTGENTMNIYVVQSGTYCVTVTDASGCTAEDCVDVDFSNFCDVYIWLTGAGSLNANTQGIFPVSLFLEYR
jgi:hypothetical protein